MQCHLEAGGVKWFVSRGEQGAKVEGQRWAPFVKETSYARRHRHYLGTVIDFFFRYSSY